MKAKVNWQEVREDYVRSPDPVTKQDVADRHGVRRETLTRRAMKEGWDAQRARYQHELVTRTRERTLSREAELRARQARIGRDMQDLARGAMARHLIGNGEDGKPVPLISEPAEIRRFLVDGAKLERAAVGVADEVRLLVQQGFESHMERLRQVLSPEAFQQVLDVVSGEGAEDDEDEDGDS